VDAILPISFISEVYIPSAIMFTKHGTSYVIASRVPESEDRQKHIDEVTKRDKGVTMEDKPQFTVNELTMEIWPLDTFSRNIITKTLGRHQIGYNYKATTMGMPSMEFRTHEDYKLAIGLLK